MGEFSLTALGITLAILLIASGVFSLAETAMMAANRYRLKHRAARGERGAKLAIGLLNETDRLLGVILLGNNLINAAAATLTAVIVERLFGEGQLVLAAGTVAVTFAILVFSEITPKVIGATHADRLAPYVSFVLTPLLKPPITWIVSFVNVFVQGLLRLFRVREPTAGSERLTREELRSLVLEGQYFRGKHRAMLANLFELENITVDHVMTPRHLIHGIDLAAKPALLRQQLATSYHTRMPVYEERLDNVVGMLHVKQVVALQQSGEIDAERLRELLRPAYFVPVGTPLLTQLTQFQNDRQRMGLVVDEYGELKGLTTIEDIVEEIIGEFTTTAPGTADDYRREADGSVIVDGMSPLRMLNRRLGTRFPLDGPKTLNGLIVEAQGDIPEAGLSFSVFGQRIEILQTQDRAVRVVRLVPPVGRATSPALQSVDERASSPR
ncbi:MAG TPA: CNNM domain-containing protein [Casimicrobiaceae bacterium]|nr:CNNM domain-containing protein [Casimicrobiaceae bacterium]